MNDIELAQYILDILKDIIILNIKTLLLKNLKYKYLTI